MNGCVVLYYVVLYVRLCYAVLCCARLCYSSVRERAFENSLRSDCVRSRGMRVRARSGHKMRVLDGGTAIQGIHCSAQRPGKEALRRHHSRVLRRARSGAFGNSAFENADGGLRSAFGARSCVCSGSLRSGAFESARSRTRVRYLD